MLTAVYGSSEYAQALSRTGSIYGNIFIVNQDTNIHDLVITQKFEQVSFKFNDSPLKATKGLIVGPDYHSFVFSQLGLTPVTVVKKCIRTILITREPFLNLEKDKVATFVYPPGSFNNTHAIRAI